MHARKNPTTAILQHDEAGEPQRRVAVDAILPNTSPYFFLAAEY